MRSLVVLVILGMTTAPAAAESEADRLFLEGRERLNNGDAKGACEKFHAANEVDPNAYSVMLNLGLCYEAQGKLASALKWYRTAQNKASEAQPQTEDTRQFEAAAKTKKVGLAEQVAKITIEIGATQDDVVVTLDGTRLKRNDLTLPVEVDAGSHAVEARAPGMTPYVETVEITDGQVKTVKVPPLAKAPPPPPPPAPAPRSRRPLGIVLVATGGVLLAGNVAFNLYLQANDESEQDRDRGKSLQRWLLTPAGVVAGAAVVAGVYFIIKQPRRERRTAVLPVVSPETFGVAITGGF